MLIPIEHRFPQIKSEVEFYINYSDSSTNSHVRNEIIFTVIKYAVMCRLHYRIYTVEELCKQLSLSQEERLIWFMKFGDILPRYITQLPPEDMLDAKS